MRNPRHEAKTADDGTATEKKKLPAGAPVPTTFRSVVIRSLIAAFVFMLLLSLGGGSAGGNVVLVVAMFLFLLVFGYLSDRWFYRWRLRRWERTRAGGRGTHRANATTRHTRHPPGGGAPARAGDGNGT